MKTVFIGIFVIIAAAIIVSMLLFIHPTVGDNAKTLIIRFADVDKIDVGTRITYAGHPVGEVVSIKEVPEARTSRLNFEGDVYIYEIEAKVDSSVDVYNTDEITVRTSGLLGEKNIEINPLPPTKDQPLFKVENQILYAVPVSSVESSLKSFAAVTKKINDTLEDIQITITTIQQEKIVEGVSKITKNLVDITHALNQPEKWSQAVDHITELADKANTSWKSVDETIQNVHAVSDDFKNKSWPTVEKTIDQLHLASANTNDFTQSAKQIIKNTEQGQGTVGKLLVGNDLYLQLKSVMHKGSNLMTDVNQYGLLFQTNKRWQRMEAQRRQLVRTLSDPNQFATYFNNEMNQISSSLSDVSMILNETDYNDPRSLYFNPEFTTRFYQLMKNVENMEETIKLYNEELASQE